MTRLQTAVWLIILAGTVLAIPVLSYATALDIAS